MFDGLHDGCKTQLTDEAAKVKRLQYKLAASLAERDRYRDALTAIAGEGCRSRTRHPLGAQIPCLEVRIDPDPPCPTCVATAALVPSPPPGDKENPA